VRASRQAAQCTPRDCACNPPRRAPYLLKVHQLELRVLLVRQASTSGLRGVEVRTVQGDSGCQNARNEAVAIPNEAGAPRPIGGPGGGSITDAAAAPIRWGWVSAGLIVAAPAVFVAWAVWVTLTAQVMLRAGHPNVWRPGCCAAAWWCRRN